MICKNCGSDIDDKAVICVKCGVPIKQAPIPSQFQEDVPNHLALAILVTIFCCLPFGIPAIVFASQVNSKLAAGDVEGAKYSSRKAKNWCIASICCVLAIFLIYVLAFVIGAVGTADV